MTTVVPERSSTTLSVTLRPSRINDLIACRVITSSWNTSKRRIAAGDLATTRFS